MCTINETSAVQHFHRLSAPGGLPGLPETTLFYLFLLAAKPSGLRFYILIKCLVLFFPLLWESGRSPADRSDRTPVETDVTGL